MRQTLAISIALYTGFASAEISPEGPRGFKSGLLAVAEDGAVVAANPDSNSVSVLRAHPTHQLIAELPVGRLPQTVAVLGREAFVANRDENTLAVVDLDGLRVSRCVDVAAEPFGVVAGGDRVYVTHEGAASVGVIDAATLRTLVTLPLRTRPRGMALSSDGSRLYVSHFNSGRLSVIDTATLQVLSEIAIGGNPNVSQSIVLDQSQRAYLPQTLFNSDNRALVFDSTVFPVVSVVDLDSGSAVRGERIALDIADRPVGLPLDAVLHRNGSIYVTNAASNDISVIDLIERRARAHIEVGSNPRGIALSTDHRFAYVNNVLDGTLSIIDTSRHEVTSTLRLTEIPLSTAELNGKRLFNSSDDSSLARNQWVACATCHFDGESDGQTWFFADGPRNTPSLLGTGETGPWHWSGDLDELEDVESSIRSLQAGTGLAPGPDHCSPACDLGPPNSGRSQDLDDLADYMRSLAMRPTQAGMLLDATAMERGHQLFHSSSTGCSTCHVPPQYIDGLRHDVGSGESAEERKGSAFDTPTLRGLTRTAPYLHDGSATTLKDVLVDRNPDDRHGRTAHLETQQIADLIAFLSALPEDRRESRMDSLFSCGQANRSLGGIWRDQYNAASVWWFEIIDQPARPNQIVGYWLTTLRGRAIWLYGLGELSDSGEAELDLSLASGALFPPEYRSSDVHWAAWGKANVRFLDRERATVTWSSRLPDVGVGTLELRQSQAVGLGDTCLSGSYYSPSLEGQGFVLQVSETHGRAVVSALWLTQHEQQPLWLAGEAELEQERASLPLRFAAEGPAGASLQSWGELEIQFHSRHSAVARWQSSLPGFAPGTVDLVRLTEADHNDCRPR